ncbi:MAG: phospholipase C [Terracidiphilus sp.]
MRNREIPATPLITIARRPASALGVFTPCLLAVACILAGACILVSLTGCASVLVEDASKPSPLLAATTVHAVAGSPIERIVVIMQENRSFDNLFHDYPGADTVQSGMSKGVSIPLKPVGLAYGHDLKHTHPQWWKDWDHGAMDGFAQSGADPPTLAYSYVPRKDVEPYWDLAEQYTLGDHMFQSNTGPSFVAHQYMIAGQSGDVVGNPTGTIWGCDADPSARAPLVGPNGTDLPGVFPCFDYQTMADLLDARGITWRYYAPSGLQHFYILSAYQAIRHIRYGKDWKKNVISPQNRVLTDIAAGELAQVTWIVPDLSHSDHPASGSLEGPDWVASIVNAIGTSKYWNSTAIFISWDDWGGWYDHVDPPVVDNMGPGFRVPVLVVSPYARHGYVSHQFHLSSGFNTFIEENFDLPSLGARDAVADDFADCFDYAQTPAPFKSIATKVTARELIHEASTGPPDDD